MFPLYIYIYNRSISVFSEELFPVVISFDVLGIRFFFSLTSIKDRKFLSPFCMCVWFFLFVCLFLFYRCLSGWPSALRIHIYSFWQHSIACRYTRIQHLTVGKYHLWVVKQTTVHWCWVRSLLIQHYVHQWVEMHLRCLLGCPWGIMV